MRDSIEKCYCFAEIPAATAAIAQAVDMLRHALE
jgi:hypothetical protein